MKAVPGSRHSTVVLITNPSEETIQVDCRVAPPPELVGLIRGGQNAEQFSCAPWVQVTPAQFTLRGGQARNVRLDAMLPAQRDALPDYYANLSIRSTFADGQSGGNMQVPIWVQNTKGSAVAKVLPVTLTIAQQEGNAYAVSGKFVNAGTIHLTPAVKANLVTSTGRVISVQPLQASTSQMLPLTMPEFSGTLDFTKVPEGTYSIRAVLTYGEKAEESISIPVKVEIGEQDVRVVTVLGADGTAPASETPTPDATEAK